MRRRAAWRRTAGGRVYSRTDNALTALWKASYAGDPWVPSVGSAGNLVTASGTSAPTVGTPQNSLDPAALDGSSEALQTTAVLSDLFTASAGGLWMLVKPSSGSATGAPYAESALLTDTGGDYFVLAYTTSGFRFTISDGAYKSTAYVACGTGAYHLVQCKWDGVNAKIRLDGAAAVSVACGNLANLTRVIRIGVNFSTTFFGGDILEIGTKAYTPSDAEEDNDLGDINTVYGLSL